MVPHSAANASVSIPMTKARNLAEDETTAMRSGEGDEYDDEMKDVCEVKSLEFNVQRGKNFGTRLKVAAVS